MPHATPDIAALFAAHAAGVAGRRLHFGYAQRRAALQNLDRAVQAHETQIIAALNDDFAKPAAETVLTEILPVLHEIRHAIRHLRAWMRPRRAAQTLAMLGTSAQTVAQARGTCLIIAPWNYPFMLALGPLVSALAAGNSAIVKPSEQTPATSAVIAQIIADTFPPDLVATIQGGIRESEALLALPFDHIFFTGSPEVGRRVMAAAAQNLSSVTLELGGKSPTIVGPDANIQQAARWINFGKFVNAGQTCVAPDHVYVHRDVKDAFVTALRSCIAHSYGAGNSSPHLAKVVNDRHAARLAHLLHDALAKGARLIAGAPSTGRAFAPTLIESVTPEMDILAAEIFGPILPILPYDDLNLVLDRINAGPKPLSLYIFDKNRTQVQRILAATTSGSVGVNLTLAQFSHLNLPFGGVGMSGMGSAHGRAGFDAFSHQRAMLTNHAFLLPLMFAPYSPRVRWLIDLVKRYLG